MKVGLVGLGSIGRRHIKNLVSLSKELEITEIRCYDRDCNRLESIASLQSDLISPKKDLANTVEDSEIAFVCVPTAFHLPVTEEIRAYNNQLHIYLEKPISHSLLGCEELVYKQIESGKVLAIGYMLPNHPLLKQIEEILKSNRLGKVLSVRAESGFYLPNWHPWENYQDFYMSSKYAGGGALLDSSHEINYLQWLFGDIVEVSGYLGTVSELKITSDDLALGILKFTNGIIGQLQLDLLQFEESRECKIIGENGILIADFTKNELRYYLNQDKEWTTLKLEIDFEDIYLTQIREFFKLCKGQKASLVTGMQALKTMHVIEGIRRSHTYSTSVKLPLYS